MCFGLSLMVRSRDETMATQPDDRFPAVKALTIRQPWAYAIMRLGKDVENRSWPTDHRGPLLIHASARAEAGARELLSEYIHRGELPSDEFLRDLPTGCIFGVVRVKGCIQNSKSKWANPGMWHWVLEAPRPIEPAVKCIGRLGLWTPAPEIVRQLPGWIDEFKRKS
jgi:hypothetical protein